MRSGPKPKPTFLKVLSGNPGKRKLPTNEPKPKGNLHECPDWFDDEQRASWEYVIENAPPGMLKRLDRAALTSFCIAETLHKKAALAVSKDGLLRKSPNGHWVQHPMLVVLNKQAMLAMRAAAELGFTPASRTRVTADPPKDEDEYSEFQV